MRYFAFLFCFLIFSSNIFTQDLTVKEIFDSKIVKNYKSSSQSIVIINSDLELTFEASNDLLDSIQNREKQYIIPISAGSQILTVISSCCGRYALNFLYNDLGVLKNGDVKIYEIRKTNPVGFVYEITEREKNRGVSDFPVYNEKDGYIFFYTVNLNDIELVFTEKNNYIYKYEKELDRYKLFVKSGVALEIKLSASEYDDLILNIDTLEIKGVRYFRLQQLSESKIKSQIDVDVSLDKGSYKIISEPSGAIVEIDGNPYFNEQPPEKRITPLTLNDVRAGALRISISKTKYESITDTIIIGGKNNISRYNLIPKFSILKFDILPSTANIKINNIQVIENSMNSNGSEGSQIKEVYLMVEKSIEVSKGNNNVEIFAPHFYSQSLELNTLAGEIKNIKIKLIPVIGFLKVDTGFFATDADCFIESKELQISKYKIGKIPLDSIPLQEGDYTLFFEKKGFASEKVMYNISIKENQISKLKVNLLREKNIQISTVPDNAEVFINGKLVGKSDFKIKLPIGQHILKVERENYYPFLDTFIVNQENNIFKFVLKPKVYDWNVLLQKKADTAGLKVFINDTLQCYNYQCKLPEGSYKLTIKKNKINYFRGKVKFPEGKLVHFPLYSSYGGNLFEFNISPITKGYEIRIITVSLFGFSFSPIKFFPIEVNNNKFVLVSAFSNVEFRIGGAVLKKLDISLMANFGKFEEGGENSDNIEENKDYIKLTQQFFGLELATRNITRGFFDLYLQFGRRDITGSYALLDKTKNDYSYLPSVKFNQSNISVTLGMKFLLTFSNSNNILRLWKKPLLDNFYY
ncbi:MAG: PEGA domain-containing protein [Candidatus Delongbacteria bacterium]|nr:PEGA domain-containing protein [Candidatus Delongbacteria bacterium]